MPSSIELLYQLYYDRGIEFSVMQTNIQSCNIPVLTEIVCIILDRDYDHASTPPLTSDTLFASNNANLPSTLEQISRLVDYQQYHQHHHGASGQARTVLPATALLPGTSYGERRIINTLGINLGYIPCNYEYSVLYEALIASNALIFDFIRILRSRTDWTSTTFRHAILSSRFYPIQQYIRTHSCHLSHGHQQKMLFLSVLTLALEDPNETLELWLGGEYPFYALLCENQSLLLDAFLPRLSDTLSELLHDAASLGMIEFFQVFLSKVQRTSSPAIAFPQTSLINRFRVSNCCRETEHDAQTVLDCMTSSEAMKHPPLIQPSLQTHDGYNSIFKTSSSTLIDPLSHRPTPQALNSSHSFHTQFDQIFTQYNCKSIPPCTITPHERDQLLLSPPYANMSSNPSLCALPPQCSLCRQFNESLHHDTNISINSSTLADMTLQSLITVPYLAYYDLHFYLLRLFHQRSQTYHPSHGDSNEQHLDMKIQSVQLMQIRQQLLFNYLLQLFPLCFWQIQDLLQLYTVAYTYHDSALLSMLSKDCGITLDTYAYTLQNNRTNTYDLSLAQYYEYLEKQRAFTSAAMSGRAPSQLTSASAPTNNNHGGGIDEEDEHQASPSMVIITNAQLDPSPKNLLHTIPQRYKTHPHHELFHDSNVLYELRDDDRVKSQNAVKILRANTHQLFTSNLIHAAWFMMNIAGITNINVMYHPFPFISTIISQDSIRLETVKCLVFDFSARLTSKFKVSSYFTLLYASMYHVAASSRERCRIYHFLMSLWMQYGWFSNSCHGLFRNYTFYAKNRAGTGDQFFVDCNTLGTVDAKHTLSHGKKPLVVLNSGFPTIVNHNGHDSNKDGNGNDDDDDTDVVSVYPIHVAPSIQTTGLKQDYSWISTYYPPIIPSTFTAGGISTHEYRRACLQMNPSLQAMTRDDPEYQAVQLPEDTIQKLSVHPNNIGFYDADSEEDDCDVLVYQSDYIKFKEHLPFNRKTYMPYRFLTRHAPTPGHQDNQSDDQPLHSSQQQDNTMHQHHQHDELDHFDYTEWIPIYKNHGGSAAPPYAEDSDDESYHDGQWNHPGDIENHPSLALPHSSIERPRLAAHKNQDTWDSHTPTDPSITPPQLDKLTRKTIDTSTILRLYREHHKDQKRAFNQVELLSQPVPRLAVDSMLNKLHISKRVSAKHYRNKGKYVRPHYNSGFLHTDYTPEVYLFHTNQEQKSGVVSPKAPMYVLTTDRIPAQTIHDDDSIQTAASSLLNHKDDNGLDHSMKSMEPVEPRTEYDFYGQYYDYITSFNMTFADFNAHLDTPIFHANTFPLPENTSGQHDLPTLLSNVYPDPLFSALVDSCERNAPTQQNQSSTSLQSRWKNPLYTPTFLAYNRMSASDQQTFRSVYEFCHLISTESTSEQRNDDVPSTERDILSKQPNNDSVEFSSWYMSLLQQQASSSTPDDLPTSIDLSVYRVTSTFPHLYKPLNALPQFHLTQNDRVFLQQRHLSSIVHTTQDQTAPHQDQSHSESGMPLYHDGLTSHTTPSPPPMIAVSSHAATCFDGSLYQHPALAYQYFLTLHHTVYARSRITLFTSQRFFLLLRAIWLNWGATQGFNMAVIYPVYNELHYFSQHAILQHYHAYITQSTLLHPSLQNKKTKSLPSRTTFTEFLLDHAELNTFLDNQANHIAALETTSPVVTTTIGQHSLIDFILFWSDYNQATPSTNIDYAALHRIYSTLIWDRDDVDFIIEMLNNIPEIYHIASVFTEDSLEYQHRQTEGQNPLYHQPSRLMYSAQDGLVYIFGVLIPTKSHANKVFRHVSMSNILNIIYCTRSITSFLYLVLKYDYSPTAIDFLSLFYSHKHYPDLCDAIDIDRFLQLFMNDQLQPSSSTSSMEDSNMQTPSPNKPNHDSRHHSLLHLHTQGNQDTTKSITVDHQFLRSAQALAAESFHELLHDYGVPHTYNRTTTSRFDPTTATQHIHPVYAVHHWSPPCANAHNTTTTNTPAIKTAPSDIRDVMTMFDALERFSFGFSVAEVVTGYHSTALREMNKNHVDFSTYRQMNEMEHDLSSRVQYNLYMWYSITHLYAQIRCGSGCSPDDAHGHSTIRSGSTFLFFLGVIRALFPHEFIHYMQSQECFTHAITTSNYIMYKIWLWCHPAHPVALSQYHHMFTCNPMTDTMLTQLWQRLLLQDLVRRIQTYVYEVLPRSLSMSMSSDVNTLTTQQTSLLIKIIQHHISYNPLLLHQRNRLMQPSASMSLLGMLTALNGSLPCDTMTHIPSSDLLKIAMQLEYSSLIHSTIAVLLQEHLHPSLGSHNTRLRVHLARQFHLFNTIEETCDDQVYFAADYEYEFCHSLRWMQDMLMATCISWDDYAYYQQCIQTPHHAPTVLMARSGTQQNIAHNSTAGAEPTHQTRTHPVDETTQTELELLLTQVTAFPESKLFFQQICSLSMLYRQWGDMAPFPQALLKRVVMTPITCPPNYDVVLDIYELFFVSLLRYEDINAYIDGNKRKQHHDLTTVTTTSSSPSLNDIIGYQQHYFDQLTSQDNLLYQYHQYKTSQQTVQKSNTKQPPRTPLKKRGPVKPKHLLAVFPSPLASLYLLPPKNTQVYKRKTAVYTFESTQALQASTSDNRSNSNGTMVNDDHNHTLTSPPASPLYYTLHIDHFCFYRHLLTLLSKFQVNLSNIVSIPCAPYSSASLSSIITSLTRTPQTAEMNDKETKTMMTSSLTMALPATPITEQSITYLDFIKIGLELTPDGGADMDMIEESLLAHNKPSRIRSSAADMLKLASIQNDIHRHTITYLRTYYAGIKSLPARPSVPHKRP